MQDTGIGELARNCDNKSYPHIHESADFSNHTSATDIHVYVEPGEDVAFQAAHIFGHYLCDLHGDNEKYQDKIANRIARWATQKEEIA